MGNCQQNTIIQQKYGRNMAEAKDESKTTETNNKPRVFFVLGGPGAGKGTQCANLVNEFGLIHLSAGDLLRAERNSGSKDAELINNYIKEGKIVPVEITVGLIKKAMEKNMSIGRSSFVIDGFPRNKDNLDGWNKLMSDFAEVPFLLLLECTEEEMTKRILSRAEKSEVKRKDDNLETLKKRFKVFNDDTMPVVNTFIEANKCKKVQSIGDIKDIYGNIRKCFIKDLIKPKVVFVLGGPGAGKGTQCTKLANDDEFKSSLYHMSVGDVLRAERNSGSEHAELISNYIKEGKIVPVEITVDLIKKAITKLITEEGKYVFLIDGFPRNFDNYNGWYKIMTDECDVEFLLFLECTEEEMTKRILARAEKAEVKRKDDNAETLKKRFKVYQESTMPVVKAFEEKKKLIKISSIGTVDDIYGKVKPAFTPFFKKPSVVFVLGGPGAGKGTQCGKLVDEFGVVHLSAGDLLRAERNSGSKDAELINNYIKEGKIVPVEITIALIKRAMLNEMRQNNKYLFIIDGFPRNYDNLSGWNRICGSFANVPFLLFLDCDEQIMLKRILARADKADIKRKDDNAETFKKRYKVYQESTMPVVEVFKTEGKYIEIEAGKFTEQAKKDQEKTIDDVYAEVKDVFVKRLNL